MSPFINQDHATDTLPSLKSRSKIGAPLAFALAGAAGALVLGVVGWAIVTRPWAQNSNPFKPAVVASLKFPVYYPTKLPSGYSIDRSSINEPQGNVVVLTMDGAGGAKLYMSEEIRPDRYNIGGWFMQLSDLKEIPVQGGTIAVGKGDGGVNVGSRLYNNTWVITNTKAAVSQDQLIAMLKSMTLAY